METRERAVRQAIRDYATKPFVWGENDCCQFAAHIIYALTERHVTRTIHYTSEEQAEAVIRSYGGWISMVSEILDTEPCSLAKLESGDPVLLELRGEHYLGVYLPDKAIVKARAGVIQVPHSKIKAGWHICLKQQHS